MQINVQYTSRKYYDKSNINQWVWHFRKYQFIKGFNMRILGVYINVRERNALEKLIGIQKQKNKLKIKNYGRTK